MSLTLCELADATDRFGVPSLSPFCLKLHAALRLSGLPYARRHGANPGVFKAHNPQGQVPVLLDGDRPYADSTVALRRIVALAPGKLAAGPEALLWEELADTALNGFLVAARWADERNWPAVREAYFPGMPAPIKLFVPALIRRRVVGGLVARDVWRAGPEQCWDRFGRLLDALDGAIDAAAPLDAPGVAHVALYGQLRSFGTSLTPWQAGQVAARPRLAAWLAGMDARTAA